MKSQLFWSEYKHSFKGKRKEEVPMLLVIITHVLNPPPPHDFLLSCLVVDELTQLSLAL